MSEEEKKAIEWLKKAEFFSERLYAPIILNLIDKQQKEIEEKTTILLAGAEKVKQLEKEIEALEIIHTIYKEMIEENNYISKDKIREKIKKAKEIKWHTPKLVIEYFEELLEEN